MASSESSSLSSLLRTSTGTVTEEDLDRQVAELILKEAKKKAEKYSQQGIRAYIANNILDSNAPRANKRFLSTIIQSTEDHNRTVLRAQAQAAQEIKREREERERRERRLRAQEAADARRARRRRSSRHRSGTSRRSHRRHEEEEDSEEYWDRWDGRNADRSGKRKARNWETWDGETSDESSDAGRPDLKGKGRAKSGDDRSRRRRNRSRTRSASPRGSRHKKSTKRDRSRGRSSEEEEKETRRHRRDRDRDRSRRRHHHRRRSPTNSKGDRDDNGEATERTSRRKRSSSFPRPASLSPARTPSPRRKRRRSKSSGDTKPSRSTPPRNNGAHYSDAECHKTTLRKTSRNPSPSRRQRSVSEDDDSGSSMSLSRSSSPSPGPSPPVHVPSKMDKYFDEAYDPRLDVAPLAVPQVPATGLINNAEYEGWDAMLELLRLRKEDKQEQKRLERLGLLPKVKTKGKKSVVVVSSTAANERFNGESTSILDIEYSKKGTVREWDMGKETMAL